MSGIPLPTGEQEVYRDDTTVWGGAVLVTNRRVISRGKTGPMHQMQLQQIQLSEIQSVEPGQQLALLPIYFLYYVTLRRGITGITIYVRTKRQQRALAQAIGRAMLGG